MSRNKLLILFALFAILVLKATGSSAQAPAISVAQPPADPNYQQVSVPVPRVVSLFTDVARVLLSRDDDRGKIQALVDRRRARSEKNDQNIKFSVPRNKFTRTLGLTDD